MRQRRIEVRHTAQGQPYQVSGRDFKGIHLVAGRAAALRLCHWLSVSWPGRGAYDGRVSDQQAGWYPDPEGQNQQRFWDGQSWSDYYAPLVATHHQTPETSNHPSAYPYLAEKRHPDVMVAPGATRPNLAPINSAWGHAEEPRMAGGTQVFGAGTGRGAGAVAAVIALILLAVLIVTGMIWWLLSPETGKDDPAATQAPTTAPGSGAVVADTFDPEGTNTADLDAGGRYEGTFTLDEAATLALSLIGDGDTVDLHMQILNEAGDAVFTSDDRGREAATIFGGTSLDPLAFPQLPAGEYTIVIEDADGEQTHLEATGAIVDTVVEIDEPATIDIAENTIRVAVVELERTGKFTIDVQDSSGHDPVLLAVDSKGRQHISDDRDYTEGDYDPLLESYLPEGQVVLAITEWHGEETSVTVTVSEP